MKAFDKIQFVSRYAINVGKVVSHVSQPLSSEDDSRSHQTDIILKLKKKVEKNALQIGHTLFRVRPLEAEINAIELHKNFLKKILSDRFVEGILMLRRKKNN